MVGFNRLFGFIVKLYRGESKRMDNKLIEFPEKYFTINGGEVSGQVKATKAEITLLCNALQHLINTPLQTEPINKDWKLPYIKLLEDYEKIKRGMIDYEQDQAPPGQN
tara:strand:- start:1675 stop:1998 length:324 start_codon:yes stop_codon:yes gene_type:complete